MEPGMRPDMEPGMEATWSPVCSPMWRLETDPEPMRHQYTADIEPMCSQRTADIESIYSREYRAAREQQVDGRAFRRDCAYRPAPGCQARPMHGLTGMVPEPFISFLLPWVDGPMSRRQDARLG